MTYYPQRLEAKCLMRQHSLYQSGDLPSSMRGRSYTPVDYQHTPPAYASERTPNSVPPDHRPADRSLFVQAEVSRNIDAAPLAMPDRATRIALYVQHDALVQEAQAREARMAQLQAELLELCVQQSYTLACIQDAADVTHIYNGLPIHATSTSVRSLDPLVDRAGGIRKSCYWTPEHPHAWILTLSSKAFNRTGSSAPSDASRQMGSEYCADTAMEILWKFVIDGTYPT